MVGLFRVSSAALVTAALLAGCDGGASAVPVHQAAAGDAVPAVAEGSYAPAQAAEARVEPVRRIDGKPMWSASRRFTAAQNAERNFRRNGADFDASTLDAYVHKAHAFVSKPPRGSGTLTRSNGDTLIYDPAGNVFAVVTRDGAPRTMFKPDDGAEYWTRVKAREAEGGARRSQSRDDG
jgi:pyocin large subunit-like protein